MFRRTLAAVIGVLALVTATQAVAAPDAQSVFELLRGTAYDEIYSTFSDDRRSTRGTSIVCVDFASASENCALCSS